MYKKTAGLAMAAALLGGVVWAERAQRTAAPARSDDPTAAIAQLRAQVGDLSSQVAALKAEVTRQNAQIALHSANDETIAWIMHQNGVALEKFAGKHVGCHVSGVTNGKVIAEDCGRTAK